MKYSEAAKNIRSVDRHPRERRRMWSCWWPRVQSWRCITDTSVSTWNFKKYRYPSVIW